MAGTFGRVLECWDRKNKNYCAVKIVRNVKKYRDAAMIEVHPALTQSCIIDLRLNDQSYYTLCAVAYID